VPTDNSKKEPDFCVIELGGTVGDIESMPFIEVFLLIFENIYFLEGKFEEGLKARVLCRMQSVFSL